MLNGLHCGGSVELPPASEAGVLPGRADGLPDGEQNCDGHQGPGLPGRYTELEIEIEMRNSLLPFDDMTPMGFLAFFRSVTLKS